MAETLEHWVESQIAAGVYKNRSAVAKAWGFSLTTLKRGLETRFEVENLLKIAKITRESPDRILRMGKREQLADQISELYGPAPERRPALGRLVDVAALLPDDVLPIVEILARALLRTLPQAGGSSDQAPPGEPPARTGKPRTARVARS